MLNRVTLLLNVVVLIVTFIVSLTATDSQIGLMRSASETANLTVRGTPDSTTSSISYLRVVQALDGVGGSNPQLFRGENLAVIRDAIDVYRRAVHGGLTAIQRGPQDAVTLRRAYADLGRLARKEVEQLLGAHFSDPALVGRLTTTVIRCCA